jgi:uncharacterized protein YndB with AHSA1/START domain
MAAKSEVGLTTCTTPSDREIVITRVFEAPRELVFDAWTNPKHVPHWLLGPEGWTMPVCEIDLWVGGTWHFVWRRAESAAEPGCDGTTEFGMSGVYKEVVPPERVVHTEVWGPEWPETLNTLVLTEQGGKTISTLTILYATKEARDAALKTGMMDGVNVSYERLDGYLLELA